MKTGLAGFSTHSAAKLENYVLMWRINGGRWRTEWTWNPDGLAEKTDETTKKRLAYLNLLRRDWSSRLKGCAQAFTPKTPPAPIFQRRSTAIFWKSAPIC